MKSIFKGYHLCLITALLAVLMFAPIAQRAWAGWEHFDPNNTSNLPSSHINTLAMDPNRLWIGTDQGLVEKRLSSDDPNIGWTIHSKIDPNFVPVSSIDIDQNMVLWLGTQKGLVSYDPDDPNNFLIHDGLYFNPNDSESIRDIEVDTNFIWIATDMGLNRFDRNSDPNSDPFTLYVNDPNGYDASSTEAVVSREDDVVWVLPILYFGVYRYSISNDQWDFFFPDELPVLNTLIMGDSNDIWFGSLANGLWRFETDHPDPNDAWTQWEDINFGLPSYVIKAIDIYRGSNRIIVATADGITRYDLGLVSWQPINIPSSLDLGNQVITDILVDPNHDQVWFGTESGGLYLWKEEADLVPEIVYTDPGPNATNVSPNTLIQIWFNKPMDQDSFSPPMISFQAEGDLFPTSVNEEEMDFPDDPNHLVISISGDPRLNPGKKYTFTVDKNVTDLSGNPLSENYEFQFTTKAAPQVLYQPGFPHPEGTNISIDTNIAVTFTTPMDTNSVEASFSLNPNVPGPAVTGKFSWFDSDKKVVFQPDNPLTSGIQYDVTIDTNAHDKDGIPLNYPDEIPITWSFTTSDTLIILSSFPQDNEDSVSIYANIEIRFSSSMDKSSVESAFSLLDDQNTTVPGGSGWNLDSTEFSFIPSDPLDPNHTYKASITTSAESQSGSPLSQGKTWQFTTVYLETISPPVGGWPVFHTGMDPNLTSVTAMAMNPMDGGIWAGLSSLDPNSKWVGIGLFHYDGNDWKQYTSADPNCGLTSDYINDLTFDSQGNLWIATEPDPDGTGGGVNMFDGQIWNWYDPNIFYGLPEDDSFLYVNAIDVYFAGAEDLIWSATTGGIAVGRYNSNSNDWDWSATTQFPFTSLIAVDNLGGTVWVASEFFMNNPNEPCNSIVGFNAEKLSQWQPDIWDPNFRVWNPDGGLPRMKSPEERINSNLRAMTVDGFSNLWLGTKDRLYKINIDDLLAGGCNFESCDYIEAKGGLLPDSIYDIIVNPGDPNELWVATDSGISILKITEPIKSADSWVSYPLTDAMVLTMLPAASGGVYAGTDKGLLIIGDTISPTVTASYPSSVLYTNIPVSGPFWVTFSEFMNHTATEAAFALTDANSIKVVGLYSWEGMTLKFTPDETLESGIQYSMRVDTNASDLALNRLSQAYQISFQTGGVSEAWIHSTYPAQEQQSVPTDIKIQMNFNRVMDTDFTEGAFCLKVDPNFDPGSACMVGSFNWFNGNRAFEFIPDKALDQGTVYVVTIDPNARDQNGQPIPEPFSLKFRTIFAQRTLTFEGVGCFIQSVEHEKRSIFMKFKD